MKDILIKRLLALCFLLLLVGLVMPAAVGRSENRAEEGQQASFSTPLPIPPPLEGTEKNGVLHFNLQVQEGEREFYPGAVSSTLGYNGNYLGPTIRVHRGDNVRIVVENRLNEATTIHWHGAHVPSEMDGGPHQQVPANSSWQASFPIDQEAATLWYHPHLIPTTAEQVYRGLAGLFIIEDGNSKSLPLPRRYGENDIPIILQERRFQRDGRITYNPSMPDVMHGYSGNAVLVNGELQPYLKVSRGVLRLRLLNGSNSSVLRIQLENQGSFLQIASDGGFLEQPVEMRALVLSPAERAEILIDFRDVQEGEKLHLLAETNGGETYRVLQLIGSGDGNSSTGAEAAKLPFPDTSLKLNTIEPIPASEAERSRSFVMSTMGPGGRLTINGKTMNMNRIDERVPLGATEIWQIEHGRGMMGRMMNVPHSFHVHDGQFQILSVNGRPPSANEAGWKDTVLLWPGDVIRVIKRFEDYTGIYMYHCHLLEHEDAGMMGQFEVVEP
ncbi:MAG: multicopper oxidase domain-containing protein [Spirochaetota bacterium]|nr:multicopper oxidase domain-containing protein [Spirochaetota bacterium]